MYWHCKKCEVWYVNVISLWKMHQPIKSAKIIYRGSFIFLQFILYEFENICINTHMLFMVMLEIPIFILEKDYSKWVIQQTSLTQVMSTSMKSVGFIIQSRDLGLAGGVATPWGVGLEALTVLAPAWWVEDDEDEEAEEERTLPVAQDSVLGFTVAVESEGARPDTWRISAVFSNEVRSSAATVISPLK